MIPISITNLKKITYHHLDFFSIRNGIDKVTNCLFVEAITDINFRVLTLNDVKALIFNVKYCEFLKK